MFFSRKRINRNYEKNADQDLTPAMDPDGLLNGQDREGLRSLSFGYSNVGKAGCESVALYNALRLLGKGRPLAEIIRDMEKGGYLRFGGHLGAVPYFQPLLRRYGATARPVSSRGLQRAADHRELTPGAVFLMAIWNRRFLPHKGLHTFTAAYSPGEDGDWLVYNRFNTDRSARRYPDLESILKNGKTTGAYLVIYRVYPL